MNFFDQLMNIEIKKSMGIYNTTDEFFCLFLHKISRETNKNILMVVNTIYEANKLYNSLFLPGTNGLDESYGFFSF